MKGESSKRWGLQQEDLSVTDLLAKKDQQITRLQGILEWQRRRAEHALQMLDCHKRTANQSEQASQGLKSQITRRIKAQQQVKRLQKRNEQLEQGIKKYVQILKIQLEQKKQSLHSVPQPYEQ